LLAPPDPVDLRQFEPTFNQSRGPRL
jgi:hypothetical protein